MLTPEQPFSLCLPCRRLVLSLPQRGAVVRPACDERSRFAQSSLNHDLCYRASSMVGQPLDGVIPASRLYARNGFILRRRGSAANSSVPYPGPTRHQPTELLLAPDPNPSNVYRHSTKHVQSAERSNKRCLFDVQYFDGWRTYIGLLLIAGN